MSKIIAFDLDDVICRRPKEFENEGVGKYQHCVPIPEMVNIVNECYDNGHYIKIYTARGMSVFSGDVHMIYNKLFLLTKNHLEEWGVKYHELIMGKAHYDILIDDKVVNSITIQSYSKIVNHMNFNNEQ